MRGTPARRVLAAATLLVSVLSACTDTAPEAAPTPSADAAIDLTATEAGDIRLELETLFGLSSHLQLEEARASTRAARAVGEALTETQEALVAVVSEAYDDEAGRGFDTVWSEYLEAGRRYARAANREADTSKARRALLRAAEEVGAFLATTTDEHM